MNAESLYRRLVAVIDVPVIETSEIWTKGIFIQERGQEPRIYIKEELEQAEKLQVLLYEYVHYLHTAKYYEQESRAEAEFIAESAVFFILREFNLTPKVTPAQAEFTKDADRIKHLSTKIQQISEEIIALLHGHD